MEHKMEQVTVIGAGVMGSGIASHLLNCGLKVLLLDIVPNKLTEEDEKLNLTTDSFQFRNKFVLGAQAAICDRKKGLLYDQKFANNLTIGNLEDNIDEISKSDWVIEVVVERLDIKQDLFMKLYPHLKEGAIVSTNTSGLSVNKIAAGLPEDIKHNFLGTHFFNPVRFMHLIELIPTEDTSPEVVEFMDRVCTKRLGKGVVITKDTPNFIGNRIGVYSQCDVIKIAENYDFNFAEIDQITGPLLMRPGSASFRTVDLVGLDILAHTAKTSIDNIDPSTEDLSIFELPEYIKSMLENKQLGNKTRGGFYKRTKIDGKKAILLWNPTTGEYEPMEKTVLAGVAAASKEKTAVDRLCSIIKGDLPENHFAWEITRNVMLYSANLVPEITEDFKAIDKAMRWGYNWSMGPFQIWDALGVEYVINRMENDGLEVPAWVKKHHQIDDLFYAEPEHTELHEIYPVKSSSNNEINALDLGDGILGIEFVSPGNAISGNMCEFIQSAIEYAENSDKYRGIVIANNGKNFSAGANLANVAKLIENNDYDAIEKLISLFQETSMRIRYASVPVVASIHNMTLGGGNEIAVHCHKTVMHQETYRGFVEVGVGIVPAGAGFVEMLRRSHQELAKYKFPDLGPRDRQIWELIAMAKVSKNAYDADKLGFVSDRDIIVADRSSQLDVAKKAVINMLESGFVPNVSEPIRVTGITGFAALKYVAEAMYEGNFISEHDFKISLAVAETITGGNVPKNTLVTEKEILALEHKNVMELIKDEKTQARIKHMVMKNKPLRN